MNDKEILKKISYNLRSKAKEYFKIVKEGKENPISDLAFTERAIILNGIADAIDSALKEAIKDE